MAFYRVVDSFLFAVAMAVGDALLCGLAEMDNLTIDVFKENHPEGYLGAILDG